jgi:hypothetical protein
MSMIVRETSLVVEGTLKYFERSSDSGRTVGNFFCPECGTRIYTKPTFVPGIVNVKPGTLDDTSWLRPELHAWTSSRQHWFELSDDLPQHEHQP